MTNKKVKYRNLTFDQIQFCLLFIYSNGLYDNMEDKLVIEPKIVVTQSGNRISIPTRLFCSKKITHRFLNCDIWQICGTRYDIEAAEKCLMESYCNVRVISKCDTYELGLLNWWTEKLSQCQIKSNLQIQDLGVYFGGHATGLIAKSETFETTEIRVQCFIR